MKDAFEAVKFANEYLLYFYPNATSIKLEEIELDHNKDFWYVTFGYLDEDAGSGIYSATDRRYKTFKIDSETGEIFSMRVRDIR